MMDPRSMLKYIFGGLIAVYALFAVIPAMFAAKTSILGDTTNFTAGERGLIALIGFIFLGGFCWALFTGAFE